MHKLDETQIETDERDFWEWIFCAAATVPQVLDGNNEPSVVLVNAHAARHADDALALWRARFAPWREGQPVGKSGMFPRP